MNRGRTRSDDEWVPGPPCRATTGSCAARKEHYEECLASIGEDQKDGTFYLCDDVENVYVCEITHCPWCGSKLRHPRLRRPSRRSRS